LLLARFEAGLFDPAIEEPHPLIDSHLLITEPDIAKIVAVLEAL